MKAQRVRIIAVLALLAVASATSPRGYCMMNRPSAGEGAGGQGAHDCCGKGIGSTPPACCHSDMTLGPTAVLGSQAKEFLLASTNATWIAPLFVLEAYHPSAAPVHRPHSPPLTVLRI